MLNADEASSLSPSAPNPLKALDILEGLAQCPKGAGVSELAEMTNLSKSSVHRILMALTQRQYVVKDEHAKVYRLGFRPLLLASAVLDNIEIKHVARGELRKAADVSGETVHLICRDGYEGVYVDKVDTKDSIGLKSQIGKTIPLYCTGGGKAILAHMNNEFLQSYIGRTPLLPCTPNTITTPEGLMNELSKIRRDGFALDNGEHHIDIICISVPLLNREGEVVASMSISAPSYRFPVERALSYQGLLRQCAESISMRLL